MKTLKKLFSIFLALIVVCSMTLTAFAAEITVQKAVKGETYKAYKIFDVVYSGDNYSYTMTSDNLWKSVIEAYKYDAEGAAAIEKPFTLTASAADPNLFIVTVAEGFNTEAHAAHLADYLAANIGDIPAAETVVAGGTEEAGVAVFETLTPGYYFVDTTLGALCALFTNDDSYEVKEKNTAPGVDKELDDPYLQIGDPVNYTVTITDSKGTDKAFVLHDEMEDGLTLQQDTFALSVVKADGSAGTITESDYTITYPETCSDETVNKNCDFEITFTDAFVASLAEGDKVVVTFTAILNGEAEIAEETNTNTVVLRYSAQLSQDSVEALSFKFDLDKTDGEGKALTGAEFELYAENEGGVAIALVVEDGVYRVATAEEIEADKTAAEGEKKTTTTIVVDENGQATVKGLDAKSYWLEETKAPAGYNPLAARQELQLFTTTGEGDEAVVTGTNLIRGVDENNEATYGVQVINETGMVLPETGGMGTTVFYVVGSILLFGATALLITKKRMGAEK